MPRIQRKLPRVRRDIKLTVMVRQLLVHGIISYPMAFPGVTDEGEIVELMREAWELHADEIKKHFKPSEGTRKPWAQQVFDEGAKLPLINIPARRWDRSVVINGAVPQGERGHG